MDSEKELSEHFSWAEANITSHRGLDNSIPQELKSTIRFIASRMERVRALLQEPIIITSWYRSPEVNKAVGSSNTSQHIRGEAVDFISPKYGPPVAVVRKIAAYFDLIKYDQLILEHGWVHISFQSIPNVNPRGQVLTLIQGGRYAPGITDKLGRPV